MSMPRASSSCGFTLIEVLIALAIASILVPAITRLAGNTRHGAAAVVSNVHTMRISQALLDRFADDPKLTAGKYSGKEEGYSWEVQVQSAPYVARTIISSPPPKAEAAQEEKADFSWMEVQPVAAKPIKQAPQTDWALVRVTAVVHSPNRRSAVLETLRLRQVPIGRLEGEPK